MGAGIMFISPNRKTLLIKRADYKLDPYSGYWNMAGGGEEEGESAYETAVRETREEIGEVKYQVFTHVETKMYTLFFAFVEEEFKPTLDHEHTDFKWVSIDNLSSYKLHPKDYYCLRKVNLL